MKGNFVLSLMPNNPLESFTCCLVNNEKLYLGTDKGKKVYIIIGSLLIYSLNGFKIICSIPYDCSIKFRYIKNKVDNNKTPFLVKSFKKDEKSKFINKKRYCPKC